MDATASFIAGTTAGRLVLESVHSTPPFSIRESGGSILIASSAAAPVGGDRLNLDMRVRSGTRARVGSVAAMVILPGPTQQPSRLDTRCVVEPGAHLDWWNEPSVSVQESNHITSTSVALSSDSTCRIVEEVSLGRSNEVSGRLALDIRVERSGRALVHHGEVYGPKVPGAGSAVSVGNARHVLSAVLVGVAAGEPRVVMSPTCTASWLPQGGDTAVVLAVGIDRPTVLETVHTVAPELDAENPQGVHR